MSDLTYEQGYSDAKSIALAILDRFVEELPREIRDVFIRHVIEPIESMTLKKKEQTQ